MTDPSRADQPVERQERILQAVLQLLATAGIAGVTMRSVAREAGVALGLVGYHYQDKTGLIAAALLRVGEQDVALVAPRRGVSAEAGLRASLRHVADPEYLTVEYVSLRLQLWALAAADPQFARINADAQQRYREGLADLIRAARPHLSPRECARRAADVDVVQNGIWLTALLGLDRASVRRSVARCEEIALAD